MCTIKLTVDMTMSIITEIGSSIKPRSKFKDPNGNHVKLKGTIVANVPSVQRSAVK